MARNIFLRVQMAAEKEGKFQRRIFSPFYRFYYAYNILDDRQDHAKKKKRDATLISAYRSFFCILLRGLLQRRNFFEHKV